MPTFNANEAALLHQLEEIARARFDGHLTIMRFTTNWRVGFGTPDDRWDIQSMASGKTFEEAARKALADPREADGRCLRDEFLAAIEPARGGSPR